MLDREHLLQQLKTLSPTQFEEVVFYFKAPTASLPPDNKPITERAIALICYAEQPPNDLESLAACLQKVLNPINELHLQLQLSKLPHTGAKLYGREDELALLQQAWENPNTSIVVLKAFGGMGKTALMQRWLDDHFTFANDYQGAQRIFTWSFYSQGTAEDRQASADEFFAAALDCFGHDGSVIRNAHDKGVQLATLVQKKRSVLLLLDGLEPLQYPEGAMGGELRDKGLVSLFRQLATGLDGLLVISSRQTVVELAGKPQVVAHALAPLSAAATQALFTAQGIQGTAAEFAAVREEYHGHALSLRLLAQYLSDYEDGDIRQRDLLRELTEFPEAHRDSRHAFKVMQAYAKQLQGTPELQLLYMLGLFDRPVGERVVAHLRESGIAPLADTPMPDKLYKAALKRLQRQQLLNRTEAQPPHDTILDSHPLVRQFFAQQCRTHYPDAWQQAHAALYDYYRALPDKEQPDTLDEMQPLFAAVVHGCAAGLQQRALEEVYYPRIQRDGKTNYLCNKLGAFGADLAVVAHFFAQPWHTPAVGLGDAEKAVVLNWAAFRLRALGRLAEAVQPMQAAVDLFIAQENWQQAAINASNLSALHLSNGSLNAALQTAQQSVALADKSEDMFQCMARRTTLADVQHQVGELAASRASFVEAEALQQEDQPEYPQLYSLRGFQYCDLLLTVGEWQAVQVRAQKWLEWRTDKDPLLDIPLEHLTLGRVSLQQALTGVGCISAASCTANKSESTALAIDDCLITDTPTADDASLAALQDAHSWLQQAVDGLRQAGYEYYLPLGLLARAHCHRFTLNLAPHPNSHQHALTDLEEVHAIAHRSGMPLFLTDYHLEACRLALTTQQPVHAQTASEHLHIAQQLVEELGYGRRRAEVRYLAEHV